MTTESEKSALNNNTNNGESQVNQEWQLAEIVDAIAAEIDHAEDTLSLKSYARGKSISLHKLSLDLEVTVRRDGDGRILFRTVEPNQTSATVIKLDFAQVLENQLRGLRKPLDKPADTRPLATLPGITDNEIKALNAIAIYSVDDLERYTQTAAMLGEVSRKTGIPDPHIRKWRQLPYLETLNPISAAPGSTVLIEGGNFGTVDPNAVVLFQGQPATIINWSESRISVQMPQVTGSGILFAVIGGQMTNTLSWEAKSVDLFVRDIIVNPAQPLQGDVITFKADLTNQGGSASGSFMVQWTIDNQPQPMQPHGTLQPGQRSDESSIYLKLDKLSPGKHTIRFTADPLNNLPDVNRANSTFSKEIVVGARKQLTIGDFRKQQTLDPLRDVSLGAADVLSLIFRGLVRRDPSSGQLIPDIAKSWQTTIIDDAAMTPDMRPPIDREPIPDPEPFPRPRPNWQQIVTFSLRDDVLFHNGMPLTADDVVFSYQMAQSNKSAWSGLMPTVLGVQANNRTTVSFYLKERTRFEIVAPQVWTLGIVPQTVYQASPEKFGLNPIGSGAFQVKSFAEGAEIGLTAFPKYMQGQPRLDEIMILAVPDGEQLIKIMREGGANAVVLPYSQQLEAQLKSNPEWLVVPLPASQPTLLQVQSKQVFERQPNAFDPNWNAHLWYIQKA